MRITTTPVFWVALAASSAICAAASADPYRYELNLTGLRFESTATTDLTVPVPGGPIQSRSRSQNDLLGIAGTWYFSDIEGNEGPLQRAAFTERASGFFAGYTRGNGTFRGSLISGDPGIPPSTFKSKQNSDEFHAGFNYVWKDSGWLVGADVSRRELETRSEMIDLDFTGNLYSVSVGKYIGATTAISLDIQRLDAEGNYTTAGTLSLTHVGDLGQNWQYSTDLSISDEHDTDSDGAFGAGFTVHPTRSLALGLNISGPLQNTSDGTMRYGLFASWFPNESIGLSASYDWSDINEPPDTDIDADGFGASVLMRF